jgi:ketosteroid isomerase-like protein
MENDMLNTVRAGYEAYAANDRSAIEDLIAPDFHFTSPLDNRIDRKTYFERCWPNSKFIEAFEFIYLVPDGQRVFVTYEARRADGTLFRNTEIVTVRGQKIVEVEVYFGWNLPHPAPPGGFNDRE